MRKLRRSTQRDMPMFRALNREEIHDLEVERAVLMPRDLTARAEMDARLRLHAAIADNAAEGIALIRAADGRILYANHKWERMFGYAHDELIGVHMSVVTAPGEEQPQARAREIIDALDGNGVWSGEIHNVRKDGTTFWSAANISRFDDPQEGTVWIAVQTDITERRAAADVHREAEQRFRTAFDDGPVGMALIGSDTRVTDANRALCKLTGYRPAELVGKSLADITHPDDVALDMQLAAKSFSGEIPRYRIDKRVVTKQHEVRPVSFTSSVARDPDGRALYQVVVVEPLDEAEEMRPAEDQRDTG